MKVIALVTAHIVHKSHAFVGFGHTLVVLFIKIVWWLEYTFSNVERAISVLEVLIKAIMANHLIRSFASIASGTIQNLFLVKTAWRLMMIIIISI